MEDSMELILVTQDNLNSLNVEQAKADNKENLNNLGGLNGLAHSLQVNIEIGLTPSQVLSLREKFGTNQFPETPLKSFMTLFLGALSDTTLLVLLVAATVSLIIGVIYEGPDKGWIEGTAIFIAVFLVSTISAGNDYSKQLQFRALEQTSQKDERSSVYRNNVIERINPIDLVVGDILVLQAGDQIPADCIIISSGTVLSNESSLTGEPDDLKKSRDADCFLLSSCLLTEGEETRAMVIGIGPFSQWGKIKANLVTEAGNTPLQDKLEDMALLIGYIGATFAFATFVALIASIWTVHGGTDIPVGVIQAFILAVTILVAAIPEGLPLAVTISLAYSTKEMYKDNCFIRVLAACETMGNATNICSDKTGTLTENRMTVVAGWFGDIFCDQAKFSKTTFSKRVMDMIVEQASINRTAYLVYKDSEGRTLDRPNIIGNKTEGALIQMIKSWGFEYEQVRQENFNESTDRVFSFNSGKKRSTAVVHRRDGSVRLYCKGATEWVLQDCTQYLDMEGNMRPMTKEKKQELEEHMLEMANMALRTLLLAHKDYGSARDLPPDWVENLPDNENLCCDCIVGIIDPLREDVKEAVATAQRAGIMVRMVTGDNIATARAIARDCGILGENGLCVEGPMFRKMTPKDVDLILPRLQVMARSSPDDKYLLVTRLNGSGIPSTQAEWEEKHRGKSGVTWENDRENLMPGYMAEWETNRPDGGEVVGVTGDGTNDAPALKAADVGLAMGITGTKVAQGASDIVILDDKFSSIVKSIKWGRSVYDNIRKFLQFQLTVNVVCLVLAFVGCVAGFGSPITAVQMLWVNLIMDSFGALALGTEPPTDSLLLRKPYKRGASLISRPMWRNILVQSAFQLVLLFVLLFDGPALFGVHEGESCLKYSVKSTSHSWKVAPDSIVTCSSFATYCPKKDRDCFEASQSYIFVNRTNSSTLLTFHFDKLKEFDVKCLTCTENDYTHFTLIFNTFIFCQVFNEFTARKLFNELNMFEGMLTSPIFFMVTIITVGLQILLITFAGDFFETTPLSLANWGITIGLAAIGIPVGVLMRLIPIHEDPNSFSDSDGNSPIVETSYHFHRKENIDSKVKNTTEVNNINYQRSVEVI